MKLFSEIFQQFLERCDIGTFKTALNVLAYGRKCQLISELDKDGKFIFLRILQSCACGMPCLLKARCVSSNNGPLYMGGSRQSAYFGYRFHNLIINLFGKWCDTNTSFQTVTMTRRLSHQKIQTHRIMVVFLKSHMLLNWH